MKRIACALIVLSVLTGCGGGGGGGASPPGGPSLDQLYQPYLGTYSASWTQQGGSAAGTTVMTLSLGTGTNPNGSSVDIVDAVPASPQNMPPASSGAEEWLYGEAFPSSATYNAGDTSITALSFVYAYPGPGTAQLPVAMVLKTTADPNVLTGTIETGTNTASPAKYSLTLTRQ